MIKGFCFTLILVVLGVLSACGGGFGPGELQSITITPSSLTLAPGNTQQLTATGNFAGSSPQDITTWVKWSFSDTSIATITTGGLLTAVSPGTVTVSAQVEWGIGTSIVVTVT